jgi:tRNA(Ile)-lysidine synthase
MLPEFLHFIEKEKLFNKNTKLLVAVSGGIDSVCLAHLLHLSGFNFAIAHCNFKLREEESNQDENFVKLLAEEWGVPCYTKQFDTELYAQTHKINIQMAARELRYEWFAQLKEKYGFDKIVTAHHKEDSIETFFINLFRGSGTSGLKGISITNKAIVRPLLFALRKDIVKHIQAFKLEYREDSSNASKKYLRNKIRQDLIPQIQQIDEKAIGGIVQSMLHLKKENELLLYLIKKELQEYIGEEKGFSINIEKLKQHPHADVLLFYALKEYNFNQDIVSDILQSELSGKQFYSWSHKAILNRAWLELIPIERNDVVTSLFIQKDCAEIISPLPMRFFMLKKEELSISADRKKAFLDADKLAWPLQLRKWQAGDSFKPLGMKGSKKVSDFLIDEKISLAEKEKTFVLCSNNCIVWLAGHRIDEDYKVKENTTNILVVQID